MPNRIVDTVTVMDRNGKKTKHHVRFDSGTQLFSCEVNGVYECARDFVEVRDKLQELAKDRVDGTGAVKFYIVVNRWFDGRVIAINTAKDNSRYADVELRRGAVQSIGKFRNTLSVSDDLIPFTRENMKKVQVLKKRYEANEREEYAAMEKVRSFHSKAERTIMAELDALKPKKKATKKRKRG